MTNELKLENVLKSYDKRLILKDLSLYLKRGEVVGLFGPNGSGKTTCFNIIIGLITPDSGRLLVDGRDITGYPMHLRAKMGISYLPQEPSVFRGLSVIDNLKLVLEIVEKDKDAVEQRAEELLAEFSISHLKYASSMVLSGGERRRLEIARTVAVNPEFIMLDEPLAGIDPLAIADLKHLISHLKDKGIGILITDHNVRDTLDIVDRAYVMYSGKILTEGTPQQIVQSEKARELYLGERFNL